MTAERVNGVAVIDENVTLSGVWRDMEKLVDLGLVRHIGVSNFLQSHLEEILQVARIKPAVQQIEIHPLLPQRQMVEFYNRLEIQIKAFATLGGGKLTTNLIVQKKAAEIGATTSQVLISFALQRNLFALVKTSKIDRLSENMRVFEVSEAQMTRLYFLETSERFFDPQSWYGLNCSERRFSNFNS